MLNGLHSVVISESKARQIFNDKDPVGQKINIDNEYDYYITGIFRDLPEQSTIKTDFIASMMSMKKYSPRFLESWGWHQAQAYLKTRPNVNLGIVERKIADLWNEKSHDRPCTGPHIRCELQPFSDVYLRSGHLENGVSNIYFVPVAQLIICL